MRRITSLRLLLCTVLLALTAGTAKADDVSTVYTFTSKAWNATCNSATADWTSEKEGNVYTAGQGVQVTTGSSGANATSPISFTNVKKIIVTYNTNKSTGKGSVAIQIGENDATTNSVAYSSGDGRSSNYTTEYVYNTYQTGNVKLTVTTTTNSIWVKSIEIICDVVNDDKTDVSLSFPEDEYTAILGTAFTAPTLTNDEGVTVSYSSSVPAVATVDASTGAVTLVGEGTTVITAAFAGDENYNSASASYTLVVSDARIAPALVFNPTSLVITPGEAFTEPTLTNKEGVEISYSSSNGSVIGVDATTGELTVIKPGTATITATSTANDTYKSVTVSYDVTVNQGIIDGFFDFEGKYVDYGSRIETTSTDYVYDASTWTAGNVTLVAEGKYRWWNADGTLRFYSNTPTSSFTVSVPNGYAITKVVITGGQAWAADAGNYAAGTWTGEAQSVVFTQNSTSSVNVKTVRVTYEASNRVDAEFEFSETAVNAIIGESFTAPTLSTASGFDGTVVYASSDDNLATVDASTGEVTIGSTAGTVTITATSEATENFLAGSASYTITVIDPNEKGTAINPFTVAEALAIYDDASYSSSKVYYTKGIVTSIKTAYSATNGNMSYYISDDGTEDGDKLQVYRGIYLNGTTLSSANQIMVGDEVVVYGKLTTYSSEKEYAQGAALQSLTGNNLSISAAGYGTFFTERAFEVPAGMTAGIISAASEADATTGIATLTTRWSYEAGATVPAGTALLIKGEAAAYPYTCVASDADAPATNLLHGSATSVETTGGDLYYMLSYGQGDKADVLGFFYGAAGGAAFTSAAGKCWLAITSSGTTPVRGFVFANDDVTGISNVTAAGKNNQAIYDLQGRRVNAAEKGIYIIGGKKVLVK